MTMSVPSESFLTSEMDSSLQPTANVNSPEPVPPKQIEVPNTPTVDVEDSNPYILPQRRLKRDVNDPKKDPLVLVACGSFNPITFLHLRMFEMAHDYIKSNTEFEVIGSYLSPVSDAYKKAGLASARDRINMCQIAVDTSATSLDLDTWEAAQREYQPTAIVLDHFENEINAALGDDLVDRERKHVKIGFLAGADLLDSMNTPGVWGEEDMGYIFRKFPIFILERMGTDLARTIGQLERFKGNIHVVPQLIQNDVSSTKIRSLRKQKMSIRYLVPDPVILYIEEHNLYGAQAVR